MKLFLPCPKWPWQGQYCAITQSCNKACDTFIEVNLKLPILPVYSSAYLILSNHMSCSFVVNKSYYILIKYQCIKKTYLLKIYNHTMWVASAT